MVAAATTCPARPLPTGWDSIEDRLKVCVHECGHVAGALAPTGLRAFTVRWAAIRPSPLLAVGIAGMVEFTAPPGATVLDRLIATAAGPLAATAIAGVGWDQAWTAGWSASRSTDRTAYADIVAEVPLTDQAQLYAAGMFHARRLVVRYERPIRQAAAALCDRGELNGSELARLLGPII